MDEILIQCSPGISGDMLLAAFYDLGVPKKIIEKPLNDIGLKKCYSLSFIESKSCSIRGIKTEVAIFENIKERNWKNIKELLLKGNLEEDLKYQIIDVYEALAIAESNVHGINPSNVHFHEIGSIDSLVDVIGVCAAINYLKPKKIFCNSPILGNGFVKTDHGMLSIPTPAVIDLVSKNNISVISDPNFSNGELSTPSGIALISKLADSFQAPPNFSIELYGVGLGKKEFPFPNLVRVLKINSVNKKKIFSSRNARYEEISIQEALIDDQSSEDISSFIEILREQGAYDVSYQSVNMKKNRIGFAVKVIIPIQKEEIFRELWWKYSNTIGLRERRQGRWVLTRKEGICMTAFGEIKCKETIKNNGEKTIKPESDEILKLQKKHLISAQEIRNIINESIQEFKPSEDLE